MGNSQSYSVDGVSVNHKTFKNVATDRYVPNYSSSVCSPQKRTRPVTFDICQKPGVFVHDKSGIRPVYEIRGHIH